MGYYFLLVFRVLLVNKAEHMLQVSGGNAAAGRGELQLAGVAVWMFV